MDRMSNDPRHRRAEVLPGYPRQYERELRLPDGRAVLLRPIVPGDSGQIAEAIRTADPDTVRRRFLGMRPHVTPELLARLCQVDYEKRFALVATDARTGRGIAIARYEATGEGVADVAVAVDPAWRRVGLATALVEMLADAALDRGIHTFSAYYLAANSPVAALIGRAGAGGRQMIRDGFAEAAVALDRAGVAAAIHDLGKEGDAPGDPAG